MFSFLVPNVRLRRSATLRLTISAAPGSDALAGARVCSRRNEVSK